jgi:EAL domain-containing protein (putative c-di-GMP-specific phosphodiesterase class I)
VGLASALRSAIDHGELVAHFQPKLDLRTNLINGAETLVRWQHPKDGLIMPDQFIPLAERTGLIVPLADVVLEQALSGCADWVERFPDAEVAVNLSIGNLTNDKLITSVAELLRRYRVAPELLTLEVTESQILEDEKHHIAILQALADIGVRISVDDFGTGYASFSYLTRLPVHQVKIDKSFVGLMDVSPNDAAVVRSVIDLGRDLGIEVVAEGVEKESDLEMLRQLGCGVAQGFHIGVPMTSVEFVAMATQWNAATASDVESNVTAIRARAGTRAV